MSYGVGRRRGADPALLGLWGRLVDTAPIRTLPWEPQYAEGEAKKIEKKKKKKKKKKENSTVVSSFLQS